MHIVSTFQLVFVQLQYHTISHKSYVSLSYKRQYALIWIIFLFLGFRLDPVSKQNHSVLYHMQGRIDKY